MTNQSCDEPTDELQPWSPQWDFCYTKALGIRTSDRIVGSVYLLGMLIGLLGNGSAVYYFWWRRRKTIHDLLYLAITSVDFVSISLSIPLVASLLNDRYPILFRNHIFCTVWSSVILFTARMSMFLAMLICITRTIAMKCPQSNIKRSWVMGAASGYSSYMILIYLIFLSQRWHYCEYRARLSSCAVIFIYTQYDTPKIASYFGMVSFIIEFTVPSLITFIGFIISILVLLTRPVLRNERDNTFRRVSITITIFTAVFLVCNIPCFLFIIWESLEFLSLSSGPYKVMQYYYAQLMLQLFPIFVNAAINPVLYFLRIRSFQRWISQAFKKS
jgi:hypothetical protein